MNERITGGCQCGAVRYSTPSLHDNAHLCHCRMCQKQMGSFFAPLVGTSRNMLTWTRGKPAVFRSSEHVERGFCSACGTPLFYNDLTRPRINLTIGSLDHPDRVKPKGHDGIEGRMPWFSELTTMRDYGETEAGDSAEWAAAIRRTNRQHPDHDTETWPPEERA
jgi:hypothetical protein